mgnify:CR=1 FL=1
MRHLKSKQEKSKPKRSIMNDYISPYHQRKEQFHVDYVTNFFRKEIEDNYSFDDNKS